jgi:hypothetical protein
MRPKEKVPLLWCRYRRVDPSILGCPMGQPLTENWRWSAKGYKQGQEANYKLLPYFLGDHGATLGALVIKFFKNDAPAAILP